MDMIEGTVGIPANYFLTMAKHDYLSWRMALPREFYQNSIDANASRIGVIFDEENRKITIADDGVGMSLSTLKDKLLVLGGSHKQDDSVGAFGKAKEVLFFSWEAYQIKTRNLICKGIAASYTIEESKEVFDGTECTIKIPEDECFTSIANEFSNIATKMQTNAKIFVDGVEIVPTLLRGELAREVDGIGSIYQTRDKDSIYMPVRINGIWMFNMYIGEGKYSLIFELQNNSLEFFTSNRDDFKWAPKSKVSTVIEELMVDTVSALNSSSIKEATFITEEFDEFWEQDFSKEGEGLFNTYWDSKEDGFLLEDFMHFYFNNKQLGAYRYRKLENLFLTSPEVSKFSEFLFYKPQFFVKFYDKDKTFRFLGTNKAKIIAVMWEETIKQVLLDNSIYFTDYSVGFTFDDSLAAALQRFKGISIVFVNPKKLAIKDRWDLVCRLAALACHELTHLKFKRHNEDFVLEFHDLQNSTYKSKSEYLHIGKTR